MSAVQLRSSITCFDSAKAPDYEKKECVYQGRRLSALNYQAVEQLKTKGDEYLKIRNAHIVTGIASLILSIFVGVLLAFSLIGICWGANSIAIGVTGAVATFACARSTHLKAKEAFQSLEEILKSSS